MYPNIITKPIDYNATYTVELVDNETIRLTSTLNSGETIKKEVVSKVRKLADIESTVTELQELNTSNDEKITFLNELTTLINGAQ